MPPKKGRTTAAKKGGAKGKISIIDLINNE